MNRSSGLFPNMRLRSKLLGSNLLIAFLAIVGITYYVLNRAQTTNSYLIEQLNQSVTQETENKINGSAEQNATELNNFFTTIKNDLTGVGTATQSLLSQESSLIAGNYWDARKMLVHLDAGNWDNINSEKGSIFIPSSPDIPDTIVSELNALRQIDYIAPSILQRNPATIAIYFGSLEGETIYYPNIDLATLLPPDFDITQRPWFIVAEAAQNPLKEIVWSVPYQDAALHGLVITSSAPIYDFTNKFRGVVAMDVKLDQVASLVSKIRIGETGYAFLIDSEGRVIGMADAGYKDFGLLREDVPSGESLKQSMLENSSLDVFEILVKMARGQNGLRTVTLNGVEKYIVYKHLPSVNYSLGMVVPQNELNIVAINARQRISTETANTLRNTILIISIVLAISLLVSLWFGNTITFPLLQLTETAQKIAEGDLEATAKAQTRDEIGILANALNIMTRKLRELINSLEQRVAERTTDLEIARQQSEKRARELQTVGEISSIVASEQRTETLLPLITHLVSERFNFYHVGIFLVDESNQWAVLMAANSTGGQNMRKRGHKLEVGTTGIVGYVTQKGIPRIALDVGADPVFFNNPDLPTTRSEMALPLNLRGRTIGALDVQSTNPGAFTDNDTKTLSILADQIAISIENAKLFERTQSALAEIQSLYRQDIAKGWALYTQDEDIVGYHKSSTAGKLVNQPIDTEEIRQTMNSGSITVFNADKNRSEPILVVPLKLRGQVIGVLNIKASKKEHQWSFDEIGLAEAISERLALALENARLIQDSQKRAAKEQAISEITTKISGSINMRNVLQTAVEELGRALPGSEIVIEFDKKNGNVE